MSKKYHCNICGTKFPPGWDFDQSINIETLRLEVQAAKERLGPAGYKMIEEVIALRAQLKIATDALEFISWPGMDRDHWERVDAARVALKKIQEMGK